MVSIATAVLGAARVLWPRASLSPLFTPRQLWPFPGIRRISQPWPDVQLHASHAPPGRNTWHGAKVGRGGVGGAAVVHKGQSSTVTHIPHWRGEVSGHPTTLPITSALPGLQLRPFHQALSNEQCQPVLKTRVTKHLIHSSKEYLFFEFADRSP